MYTHAKKNIVLGTHAKVLPDGAQFGADVFAEDVGRPRGGRKQPRQDGPFGKMKLKIELFCFFGLDVLKIALSYMVVVLPAPLWPRKEVICPL